MAVAGARAVALLLALAASIAVSAWPSHATVASTLRFTNTGKTFHQEPVSPSMVSQGTAILAALHFADAAAGDQVPADVNVRAYFGIYTDSLISTRPVWVVRFWGPGIGFTGSGGPPPQPGTPYCEPAVTREVLVVVDAKTGKYLEAMVGFEPDGVPTVVVAPQPSPTPCAARPPHAIAPADAAVSARGTVFIAGTGGGYENDFGPTITGVVQKRSTSGAPLSAWRAAAVDGVSQQIVGVAIDARDDVYLSYAVAAVQKYSPAGHLLWTWSPPGGTQHARSVGWNVSVAPNGTAYVATHRGATYVLSAAGKLIAHWPGRFDVLAASGRMVYAATVARGVVDALSPLGRLVHHWTIERSPGTGTIIALASSPDDSVYLLQLRTKMAHPFFEVVHYSPTGRVLRRMHIPPGSGPAQLVDPRGLAVGPHGTVFIVDTGNPGISLYSPNGIHTGRWTL
jgi:hypothetical protein